VNTLCRDFIVCLTLTISKLELNIAKFSNSFLTVFLVYDASETYSEIQERKILRMLNTSGAGVDAGDVVVRKAVAAGNEFTTTTTASDNSVIGIALETIANNAYGYILVKGKTVSLKVDGTTDIAVGDYLTTFTTAKIAQKGAAGNIVFARALEAYTGNDSLGVIDALLIDNFQMA